MLLIISCHGTFERKPALHPAPLNSIMIRELSAGKVDNHLASSRLNIRIPLNRAVITLICLFSGYCLLFSILSIQKYIAFNHDLDTGNMLQAFYNSLGGRLLGLSINGVDEFVCMLKGHTELVFLIILPVFALFPSVYTLLILQSVAIGSGGIAVYLLAMRRTGDAAVATLLALVYWLYPLLASINLVDFHADAFMIAPHLFAWLFWSEKRYRLFWAAILAGILVKEHAFLFNALLGIIIFSEDRKRASNLLVIAAAQFIILTPLVTWLSGQTHYEIKLAKHVVGSPDQSITETLAAYLRRFGENIFSSKGLFVLMIVFTHNLSLIKFPRGLIMIVPLSMLFIAAGSVQTHRHAILLAPLFITLVEGIARIQTHRRYHYVVGGVLLPTILAFLFSPDSLLGTTLREMISPGYRNVFHYRYTPHDAIADSLVRRIPPDVPVAADAPLRTKLVNRQYAYIHPSPLDSMRADYYLFDFFEKREYDDAWPARARIASLLKSGNFILISNTDGLVMLKKKMPKAVADDLMLEPVDTIAAPLPDGCVVNSVNIDTVGEWCTMKMRFAKVILDTTMKHAFISLFIDTVKNDTLRVLHLTTYTLCRLEMLDAGWYDETFRFNLPDIKNIENRRHEIWLYAKPGYLPFFSRQEYRHWLCRENNSVRLR